MAKPQSPEEWLSNVNPKLEGEPKIIATHFAVFVELMRKVPPSAEKTAGMRKLLEAKDCFVRAMVPE